MNGDVDGDIKMEEVGLQKDVEYVPEQLDVKDPALEAFSDVFARFQPPPESNVVRVSVTTLLKL